MELINEFITYIKQAEGFYNQFIEFTKANPVVGGMAGLWVTGMLTYLLRDVPKRIFTGLFNLADRYFTVKVVLDSGHESFYHFIKWYEENKDVTKSRTMRVTNGAYGHENPEVSLGYGFHWFMNKGWVFKLNRYKLDSQGSAKQKEEITIKTLGFTQQKLFQLVTSTFPKEKEFIPKVYVGKESSWDRNHRLPRRSWDSVILKAGQKERILNFLEEFAAEKEWYQSMGISYKTGILLEGVPGSGKTSVVKALAYHLKKNLCVVSCNTLTDTSFAELLANTPKDSIVLMEDFDSITSTKSRDDGLGMTSFGITLSGLLNAIDGVFSSDGRILIATTNCADKLDEALLRPGRFDLKENIGYADEDMVIRMFKKFYPDFYIDKITINAKIALAQVENCFLINKNNPEEAKEAVENLTEGYKVTKQLLYVSSSVDESSSGMSSTKREISQYFED